MAQDKVAAAGTVTCNVAQSPNSLMKLHVAQFSSL